MRQDGTPFRFYGTHDLTLVTNRRARDLAELFLDYTAQRFVDLETA